MFSYDVPGMMYAFEVMINNKGYVPPHSGLMAITVCGQSQVIV